MKDATCKFCGSKLGEPFLNLGSQPLCNSNIPMDKANSIEPEYPLEVYFCSECYLVQLSHEISPEEIFSNYNYLSSYSNSWLEHAKNYSNKMIEKFQLDSNSFVVEIASNDGYLLKNFVNNNIPCLGIEPASNIVEISKKNNVNAINDFFTENFADKLKNNFKKADLIVANNVFAHVPDINDFTKGLKKLLSSKGVITIEVPYLKNLIQFNQFDTIYHEHYFYYSLLSMKNILKYHGLKIFDVENLPTHGGSLRVYATHIENSNFHQSALLKEMIDEEYRFGINKEDLYNNFSLKVQRFGTKFKEIISDLISEGARLAAYGAPGKGNTLLNFCNVRANQISFTVDRNPLKQNTLLPGSKIPVYEVNEIYERRPDYIMILPWNLKDEILASLRQKINWDVKFIIPIPELNII